MKLQENNIDSKDNLLEIFKQLNQKEICEQLEQVDSQDAQYLDFLIDILRSRKVSEKNFPTYVDALIYEYVYKHDPALLEAKFKEGLLILQSESNVNYQDLQNLLINKEFLEADLLTQKKLREVTRLQSREWLYFTDIKKIPSMDLEIIDRLWRIHSLDNFGFSIQKKIWLSVNKDWKQLWSKIGWEVNNQPLRYPNEFTWDINAPKGHLPLFNQLRGVHVLSEIFNHKNCKVDS
uniref:GUN4-like domain-containing protein n=1 Tax=Porphyridium sordidum TaxID=28024 RepID=A0A1C9CE44_PORSO|nr:hypothetical protein Psor_162 [Porphyridium sordidum]AOM66637.1 hypothetical protein Psor_162 [Porphyridium sordidum]